METLKDELLDLAFQLAYFIHQDKELAKRIALAALEKVETAALAQDKRLYYPGRRSKISMTELHLLQRLVYGESEGYEKQRESDTATPPREETMLIHFIKHLVRITVKRNSLYVTLGLSRLLHQYTTAQTQELYNLVIQDPARVPSEDYLRSRKKNLMAELKQRFGELLTTAHGTRGEERFSAHDQPERFAALVRECLAIFTPWRTYCCVPEGFAPTSDTLAALTFVGSDPDAEHSIEINRFHAVLHPDCFAKLIRGLGYPVPAERLEVPRFALTQHNDEDGDEPPDHHSANLDESDRAELRSQLQGKAGQRKKLGAGLLRVVIDGAEVAQLDLRRAMQINFTLPADAEFIEVRARTDAGEVVLATHALAYGDDDLPRAQQTALVLESGQRLSFTITPARDESGALAGTTAAISYRETNWLRAARLWWQQQNFLSAAHPQAALLRPQVAFTLLFVLLTGLAAYLLLRPATNEVVTKRGELPTAASPTPATSTTPATEPSPTLRPLPTTPKPVSRDPGVTRGENALDAAAARTLLANARLVYLDLTGSAISDPALAQLRDALERGLAADSPLKLTATAEQAQVALKLNVRAFDPATGQVKLTARLVGEAGQTLWPKAGSQLYQAAPAALGNQLAKDLAKAIAEAAQR